MFNLSEEAIQTINSSIECIKKDTCDLDDIECLTAILEGELEENHPNERASRSDIRRYLLSIL